MKKYCGIQSPLAILLFLLLLSSGCETQTLYDQEPLAEREVILDTEVTITACNSHLFIPRLDSGPEAICINLFTPERAEEFGVDLSSSSITFDDEPPQSLLELIPVNDRPSNSKLLNAEIRRGHIARYSVARDGIPKVIILFPANAIQNDGEQLEVNPMGTRLVSLDILFKSGYQQQRDRRHFTITSQKKVYSILDL